MSENVVGLFKDLTSQGGIIKLEHWREGYVLWWHGELVFKSWEPGAELTKLRADLAALRALIDSPDVENFMRAVPLEAAQAAARWRDASKSPQDWFWLITFLAEKAKFAHQEGDVAKAKEHMINAAGVCLNWHRSFKAS